MSYKLLCGKAEQTLETLDAQSVQTVVTSPPYFQMRDYGYDGQIGLESTPEEYIQKLVNTFRNVRKVLRNDGTVWVNLGDTYASSNYESIKKGDLIGIPWMFAFAMRKDGWFLKSDVIWAKPNPLPGGSSNKPVASHEYFFLFSKSSEYYYDKEATKENSVEKNKDGTFKKRLKRDVWNVPIASFKGSHFAVFPQALIEPCILASTSEHGCCRGCGSPYIRDVERHRYSTRPGKNNKIDKTGFANRDHGRHLTETKTKGWLKNCSCETTEVKPCVVLDIFCGVGTTGLVSMKHGRDFVGIDGKEEYLKIAEQRLSGVRTIF